MIINKTNIKLLLGESSSTFDTRIDMLIPSILDQIIEYTKNDFLKYNNYTDSYLYDACIMSITSNTIILTTDLPLQEGDFFRLYGTSYNDGLYQIKAYKDGVINIEVTKTLRTESITNGYIALVEFPTEFINIIADHVDDNIISDSEIQREKIDDVEYTYFQKGNSGNDVISNNASVLNKYRKVFKESLFGGDCHEC